MSKDKYKKHATNLFRVIKWVDAEGNVYETEKFNGKPYISAAINDENGDTIELLNKVLKQLQKIELHLAIMTGEKITNEDIVNG